MIVLDASVVIAWLDDTDAAHQRAVHLLEREVDETLAVSVITLAEILVGPTATGRAGAVLEALADLEVSEHPLPEDAALALARLRVSTALKLPDCCVMLTAQHLGARVATFDARLATACRRRRLGALTR